MSPPPVVYVHGLRWSKVPLKDIECSKSRRLPDLPGPPQLVPQSEAALVGVLEPQVEDIDILDALDKLPRFGRGHDRRGIAGWRGRGVGEPVV